MPIFNSHHERRLLDEGALIKNRLRRLARRHGVTVLGDDADAHRLNFTGAFDIVGLIAIRARARLWTATLVCAPGYYMHLGRRGPLNALVRQLDSEGNRAVLVFKRSLWWRARRFEADLNDQSAACRARRSPSGTRAPSVDGARRRISDAAAHCAHHGERPTTGVDDPGDAAIV